MSKELDFIDRRIEEYARIRGEMQSFLPYYPTAWHEQVSRPAPHRRVSTAEDGTVTVDLAPKPVAPVWAFEGNGHLDTSKPDDWETSNTAAMIEAVRRKAGE